MADTSARWLPPEATAAHVGKRVDQLARLVKTGKLPAPSYHFGPRQPRWDRYALDAMFEGKQCQPPLEARIQEIALALAKKPQKGRAPPPR